MIQWLESRTGIVSAIKSLLTEDVPGGESYWYVFGSATLIAFVIQVVTGIILTFYYAPSAASAWESTKFIYDHVYLGKFLISLHSWGASAMIVLMTMHLLQVLLWGAYKKPREIQWVVGVLMFFFVLSMGLTGYLLPWDLNAYFATQVAINIAGSVPVIGQQIAQFLNDGSTLGTLTIGRFYGLHVWATPILIIGLIGLHLFIFRHNAPAGPPADQRPAKVGPFYPNQLFMDTVASFITFLIVVALALYLPTPLLAKADPNNGQFIPAPAWYFYALYGILRLAPAQLTLFATVIAPGIFALVLLLLPWIDRNPSRVLRRRPVLLTLTTLTIAMIVGTSVYAARAIGIEQVASNMAGQTPVEGYGASPAPAPSGGATVAANMPDGKAIFDSKCVSCHAAGGAGMPGAFPPLRGNKFVAGNPKAVIHVVLDGMNGKIVVNGQTYNGAMPAWKGSLTPAEVAAVVTYIRSLNGAKPVTEAQVKATK